MNLCSAAAHNSQVSSQQKEIAKWKARAVMLKEKTKVADKPPSPCTPTKRRLPVTLGSSQILNSPKKRLLQDSPKMLGSPRKIPGSPKKIPDSPKTSTLGGTKSYFDSDSVSEPRSKNQPFQFFDNSSLGSAAGEQRIYLPVVCHSVAS